MSNIIESSTTPQPSATQPSTAVSPQPHFPQYLKTLNQWVCWSLDIRKGQDKPVKMPRQPNGNTASTADRATWSSYGEASAAVERSKLNGQLLRGVGFVIDEFDDLVFIDVDGCYDPDTGVWSPLAIEACRALQGWSEVSMSGRGLHILVRNPNKEVLTRKSPGLEIYSKGRFCAMTGFQLNGSTQDIPMALDGAVEWLRAQCSVEQGGSTQEVAETPPEVQAMERLGYAPRMKGSGKWELEVCPWSEEHSTGPGGAVFMAAHHGGHPVDVFYCQHASCQGNNRNLAQLKQHLLAEDGEYFESKFGTPRVVGELLNAPELEGGSSSVEKSKTPQDASQEQNAGVSGGFVVTETVSGGISAELIHLRKTVTGLSSDNVEGLSVIIDAASGLSDLEWGVLREDLKGRVSPGMPTLDKLWKQARKARAEALGLGTTQQGGAVARRTTYSLPKALNTKDKAEVFPHLGEWEADLQSGEVLDLKPPTVAENLGALLDLYEIKLWFNVMNHQVEISPVTSGAFAGFHNHSEKKRNLVIEDLAVLNGLRREHVHPLIFSLADDQPYHPFEVWQRGVAWDGVSRLPALEETILLSSDTSGQRGLRSLIVKRWMLSVVACVYGYGGIPPRGVMTFTGKQNIGKTTWAARLLPEPMVKRDIRVDPAHVDSVRKAVTALICELGELDAMFRKTDISSLKGFLSQDIDEFRLPYDKVFTRHPRRTAFIATVNEPDFLKDQTGNTRFWVLSVQGLDLDAQKQIDIKQMWAEIVAMYHRGERWHMDTEEMGRIEGNNEAHREVSIEEEMLADMFEWGSDDRDVPMTRTDLMALLEIPGGRRISPAAVTAAARKLTGGSSFQTTISIPGVKLDRNANGETQEVSTVLRKKGRFWFFPEKRA